MTDRYAVMGNPIAHSRSPEIHRMFAEQTHQDLSYEAILVPADGFRQAVQDFFERGGQGINVTVPFKQDAFLIADQTHPRAEQAGAVNTLMRTVDGVLVGDNTDGEGLLRDLQRNHGVELAGRRVLLLGAGGAARGVMAPILEAGPLQLFVANRTPERADELAERFRDLGSVAAGGFTDVGVLPFDVIINATSASLRGEVPSLPATLIMPTTVCYDMVYAREPTAFMRWALGHGAAQAIDGLGMLVEQAAASFEIWRGILPETAAVINALRHAPP
ncbi:MAG: shikimate dehydrogenase [Pseudomonadota bacterium]|nr:shikimate dehydrogenase [Pseudomonadota bacterium]